MFDMLTSPYTHPLKKLIWMRLKAGAKAVWDTITGNPVFFTAKAAPLRKLEVAFSPVQDLHGYDSPWPAGGANKWDEEWENGYINNLGGLAPDGSSIRSKNFNACLPTESYYYVKPSTYAITPNLVWYDENKNFIRRTDPNTEFPVATAPSNAFFFKITAYGYGTTYKHDIAINYPSSVTTYSPYSNECPISGWDSVTVNRTLENFYDYDGTTLNATETAHLEKISDTAFRIYCGSSTGNYQSSKQLLSLYNLTIGKTYMVTTYAKVNIPDGKAIISVRNSSNSIISSSAEQGYETGLKSFLYTHTANTNFLSFFATYGNSAVGGDNTYSDITFTEVEEISISLGETVYSGYVDVVTGVVTVTMASVDMGTLSWGYSPADVRFYNSGLDYKRPQSASVAANAISSEYPIVAFGALVDKTIALYTNGYMYAKDSAYTDATAFKNSLIGVQLVYELAAPLTIQLTPQEVQSLAGDNTMWTDGDSLTVEYRSN